MSNNTLTFSYDSAESLTSEADGHYHIHVPTFYEYESYANRRIDFIFDTGAYITVVTKNTAMRLGFIDSYTVEANVPLSGFSGECLADIKNVPGFVVGGRRLEGVKVAVPHMATDMNILGLNVLEHFKYFIDTESNKIYFAQNPAPDIPDKLRCSKIYMLSAEGF